MFSLLVPFWTEPLIGLVPGIGDFAGLILSLYVYREAQKIWTGPKVRRKIIQNMLIEFVVGLIPIVGDAFNAVFKVNIRNTLLLRNYLYKESDQGFPWFMFNWVCLIILFLILALLLGDKWIS